MGKSYTKQFKEQSMKLVIETDYEPTRSAREMGMPFNTLFLWLRKAGWKKQPQPSLPVSDDPAVLRARIRELEEANRRLETEKEVLKKATAYFASQSR